VLRTGREYLFAHRVTRGAGGRWCRRCDVSIG
jgi:hypothetical protein